jgi:hypothetical protein
MTMSSQDSRQVARRICRENAMFAIGDAFRSNVHHENAVHYGTVEPCHYRISRRERRNLARAYAARTWTEIIKERGTVGQRYTSAPRSKRITPVFKKEK